MEIQEWIKNIKTIEEESRGGHTNCWDKPNLTLEIDGDQAYYKNPSTGREEKTTLEGKLKLEGELNRVEVLIIEKTNITELDLSECSNLEQITVEQNLSLTSINFLDRLPNPEKLKHLEIRSNGFAPTTLDFLKLFVNLKSLRLGMGAETITRENLEMAKNQAYNRFYGSLEPLKNLKNLRELDISDTDIDGGREYLNGEIEWRNFSCGVWLRPDAECRKLQVEKNKYEPLSKIGLRQKRVIRSQTRKSTKAFGWFGLLGIVLIGLLVIYHFLFKKKVKAQPSTTQVKG
jgi:hypothetical protein